MFFASNFRKGIPAFLLLLAISFLVSSSSFANTDTPLPFDTGSQLGNGWQVVSVERQSEFVRFQLTKGTETTGIEIVTNRSGPGEWATKHYRLMPAPGKPPAMDVLTAAMKMLVSYDSGEASLFVENARTVSPAAEDNPAKNQPRTQPLYWAWILYAAGLLLLVIVARLTKPDRRATILRHFVFWTIALLPLLILLALTFATGSRIAAIKEIDSSKIVEIINSYMEEKQKEKRPTFFIKHKGELGYWIHEDQASEFVPLSEAPDDISIYVYGGSSVVLPRYDQAFASLLQERLQNRAGPQYHVYNLGECGMDSFHVADRFINTVSDKPPDLAIVYTGHNDYSNAFRQVKHHYMLFDDSASHLASQLGDFHMRTWAPYIEYNVEPAVLRLMQWLNLIQINAAPFKLLNIQIPARLKANALRMIKTAHAHGVPIVFITPISNLYAPPYGCDHEAYELFKTALKEPDIKKRTAGLRLARDGDCFGGDIRAKTPWLDILRNLEKIDGVTVLDLETILEADGFGFGFHDFPDYLHFYPGLHRIVVEKIYQHLVVNGLIPELPLHPVKNFADHLPVQ